MLNLDLKNNILVCRRIIGCWYYSTDGTYHSFSSILLYQQEYHIICCPEMGQYYHFRDIIVILNYMHIDIFCHFECLFEVFDMEKNNLPRLSFRFVVKL